MNKLEERVDSDQVYGVMSTGLTTLGALTVLASGSLFLALFWVFADTQSNVAMALAFVGIPTLIMAAVLAVPVVLRSSRGPISVGYLVAMLFAVLVVVLSQILAIEAPRAFGLFPLVLLNCGGLYVGCWMMRVKSIRQAATWLMTVVTLAILGFASLFMSLVWVATEGSGDREAVHYLWLPTVVIVWFLGSGALVIGAQGRLLWQYAVICFGVLVVFALALEAALYMPVPFGLMGFIGLNIAAVSFAWNAFLGRLPEKWLKFNPSAAPASAPPSAATSAESRAGTRSAARSPRRSARPSPPAASRPAPPGCPRAA